MSAQNGPDEAARLEMALARIARAVSRPRVPASVADGTALQDGPALHDGLALHDAAARAKQPGAADAAVVAARLDKLIAEVRALLGPHEF